MSRLSTIATFTALVLLVPAVARAQDVGEARIYLDADANVLGGGSGSVTLRPMVRTEQRFRVAGLHLLKVSAGLRAGVLPWLMLQGYYAHKDMWSNNTHQQFHMAVLDLILHHRWDHVTLTWRLGNEYHINPGFYRLRSSFNVSIDPGLRWLRLFASEEFRFDSDQTRVNMNDVRAGVDFVVTSWLTVRTFYDLELNHRSRQDWARTHVGGLMFLARY